jgi:2-polyprenyl-3-methyl-5-hydroxy-6-metoxy-1,4-benzoquinol methylase
MTTLQLDETKIENFAEKLIGTLNGGALALMTSIGHQTGLFDTMSTLPPATSNEIATAAGLNERYVREWLGAMVTGEIVEYNADERVYSLPAEHAAVLTREASPDNIAATAQWIAVLGSVESKIVDSFRNGGGVSYTEFERFHEVMAEESAQTVVAALFEHILPLSPGLKLELETGVRVMDLGCGSGLALSQMAKAFPKSSFVGYDLCEEAVDTARFEAERLELSNIKFETRDVSKLDEPNSFDVITAFDAIHDQADPAKVLDNIFATLKTGGTFLMQDIKGSSHVENNMNHPVSTFLYTISCMHCMTVSLSQGGLGLGAMWGKEKALEMLMDAGFENVEVKELDHDMINYYYIMKKN